MCQQKYYYVGGGENILISNPEQQVLILVGFCQNLTVGQTCFTALVSSLSLSCSVF